MGDLRNQLDDLDRHLEAIRDQKVLHPDLLRKVTDTADGIREKVANLEQIENSVHAIREEIIRPVKKATEFGTRLTTWGLVVGVLGLLVALFTVLLSPRRGQSPGGPQVGTSECQTLRIAAGFPGGGVYYDVGAGIATVLTDNLRGVCGVVLPTEGSIENLNLVESGKADLGLVQSDIFDYVRRRAVEGEQNTTSELTSVLHLLPPRADNTLVVASLFDEAFHVVVRPVDGIHSLSDLSQTQVDVGLEEGGGHFSTLVVLGKINVLPIPSCDRLPVALTKLSQGKLKAIAFWRASPAPQFDHLLDANAFTLLSVDDGMRRILAGLNSEYDAVEIPQRDYSLMPSATKTIGVRALLVCRKQLSSTQVHSILSAIMEHKQDIAKHHPVALFFSPDALTRRVNTDSFHPGARLYVEERQRGP